MSGDDDHNDGDGTAQREDRGHGHIDTADDKVGGDSMDEMAVRTRSEEKAAKIMHSDTDGDHGDDHEEEKDASFLRLTEFLASPSKSAPQRVNGDPFDDLSSLSLSASDDEPPFFQRKTLENDKSVVRKMLSGPIEINCKSIMSPILDHHFGSSSDWDCDHDLQEEPVIKMKKAKKRNSKKVKRKRNSRSSRTNALSEDLEVKEVDGGHHRKSGNMDRGRVEMKGKGRLRRENQSKRRRSKQLSKEEVSTVKES